MTTRAETAAATRERLLSAAAELLDAGGPNAVTLREVGDRAGVSRSALYRHFSGKQTLLLELVARAWQGVGDDLLRLRDHTDLEPDDRVYAAFELLLKLARIRPHLYEAMFAPPPSQADIAVHAAERSLDLFLEIVAAMVGPRSRRHAALLMTSTHGAASLRLSGHLTDAKWQTGAEGLLRLLVSLLPQTHTEREGPSGD